MFKKIKIESFKSLESVELELGRLNVFIGANGSGKSNLLEAVGVLGAAASGRVDDESLLRRGVRPGVPALYKSSFRGTRQPSEIRFEAANEQASFSVGLYNPLENPEPAWRIKTELLKENGKKLVGRSHRLKIRLDPTAGYTALKAVEFSPDTPASKLLADLRQYAIYSPDTATLRGLDIDRQSRDPIGLNGGRLAEAVSSFIRHTFGDHASRAIFRSALELIGWSDGLSISGPGSVPVSKSVPQPTQILRFRDRFMADGRNYLSGYDASEGALYVLFMMIVARHKDVPGVVAVDNFDHGLNPRLAKALTKSLCEWVLATESKQLLLTSHNPLVLDGLPLRNEGVRLFTVERSNRGKTIISRVEVSEELLQQADEGVPLSQQWVMGTFGGIPSHI